MKKEHHSKFIEEIFDSEVKIYELTKDDIHRGTIDFHIMKEDGQDKYMIGIEFRVRRNDFSLWTNYGGFNIEMPIPIPIKPYEFKSLKGKTLNKKDLIDAWGCFFILDWYKDLDIHSITFGSLKDKKIEAKIEYTLKFPNWEKSKGTINTSLKIQQ